MKSRFSNLAVARIVPVFLMCLFLAGTSAQVLADTITDRIIAGENPTFRSALTLMSEGKFQEADLKFQEILKADPEHLNSLLGRAQISLNLKGLNEAEKGVLKALSINSNSSEAHNMLGVVRLMQKRPNDARMEFQKALELNPRNTTPRMYLAGVYRFEKKFDLALQEYQKLIEMAPRFSVGYLGLAETQMSMGSHERGIETLQKWKLSDAKSPEPPNILGMVYLADKRYDKALSEFDAALRISPKYAPALKNKGDAYSAKEDWPNAIKSYDAAIKTNPKYLEAYIRLGTIYFQTQDTEKAMGAFRGSIAADPNFPPGYNNVAWLLAEEGKELDEAMRLVKRAIELRPGYADAYDTLGRIYFLMGRYDKAIPALEKAKKLGGERAETLANLGMSYYQQGMKSQALAELKKALSLKKDLPNAAVLNRIISELQ